MSVLVAVVDPLPLFRDGAAAALQAAGHTVHTPTDVAAWMHEARGAIVLLTVASEADWAVLARAIPLGSATDNTLVVLLGDVTATAGVRAVRMGARSVLERGVSAGVLRRTVTATVDGQAVLPAAVAAALASAGQDAADPARRLSAERLSWLRSLATGSTVAQLADQVGYSERAMFRLLRSLYRDMGVDGRIQALMHAREQGWL